MPCLAFPPQFLFFLYLYPTSDQVNLSGYWFAAFNDTNKDIQTWELDHEDFDILLVYIHGGGFMVGQALMYSAWMDSLVNSNLRIRIYTMEYELPSKSKPETQYPCQHELLYKVYTTLLAVGISHNKIVIGGDSSGGFNTLKCFEEIIQNGTLMPGGIMLNSPLLDL